MENQTSSRTASYACYLGAFLFTVMIVMFNTVPKSMAIPVVAIAFHLVLFPVVDKLPSADWARACGYGWLILDIAANIMYLNGVDEHICTALRYGGHIPAALWIINSSLKGSRPMQIVGLLLALILG